MIGRQQLLEDNYALERVIDCGGAGIVVAARHRRLGRSASTFEEAAALTLQPTLASTDAAPIPPTQVDALLPVVGASMAGVIEMLRVFAQQEEPILISGPTGAGKSRLARWCHEQSSSRPNAFEILDLSTVPEELQMAELFGWKKGAFTGAIRDNPGLIARARGGTLFIDEIDNLSPRAQAGLLHVLEDRTYRVLGDNGSEKPAEVRFIIGTNARLHASGARKAIPRRSLLSHQRAAGEASAPARPTGRDPDVGALHGQPTARDARPRRACGSCRRRPRPRS